MKKVVLLAAAITCASGLKAQTTDTLANQKLEEVVVSGVRVQKNAPYAVANIKKAELEAFSKSGRELPFLFSQTPGVLAWGESGLGTGTAAMRIRGAAGSRINVTLDGVALNSPEDQTVFWANMNSYASLLGSVQIQRGIGTSTNGDGAFGGSISLATAAPSRKPAFEVSGSYGSYNTYNAGVKFSTGLLWNRLVLDGAYNETSTDGYVHGTQGRSGSYYGGLTYFGDGFQIRYKNIGNFEKTGQAWNGVVAGNDDASLMDAGVRTYKDMYDRGLGRFNPLYEGIVFDSDNWKFPQDANGNYQTYRYKLKDGSLWDKTTDNFYQNHNILSAGWTRGEHWSHNVALHYTYGFGYYSEFRPNNKFSKFGLSFYDKDGNFVKRSSFVRMKGLTQHTYGAVYNVNYKDEKWDVVAGLNLQQFRGGHFGYLTYIENSEADAKFRPAGTDYKYYDSDARKYDYSGYFKANYHFADYWNVFADLQYRFLDYKTDGKNDKFYETASGYDNQMLNISEHYDFVNPKAGVSFLKDGHKAYASIAYASREPERNNFTDNGNYPAPTPERLMDIELGYQFANHKWHAGVDLYFMNYSNQFVQTGAKSDIGENLTTNIAESYRMGAELSAGWNVASWLSLEGNAALSVNKIKDFDEYVDNWDGESLKIHYDNSTLAFSPSAILNGFVNAHYKGFQAVWHTNFVSRQYLDNSENKDRSLPSFSQTNINLNYTLGLNRKFAGLKEVVFGLNLNNIFNRHYAASGWVYSAVSEKSGYTNDNRYYQIGFIPMAGFTMMGNVTLRF